MTAMSRGLKPDSGPVRMNRETLAPSNAALVERVVEICDRHERPVATPAQARQILGLTAQ